MAKDQKLVIKVSNEKIIKVLNKPFTKSILDCFDEKPKTAGQIANSISFPKEKIYYHIKKLISNDLLFVTSSDLVKGIEQKLFLPTAKEFRIIKIIKTPNTKRPSLTKVNENKENGDTEKKEQIFQKDTLKRKLNERRRTDERRNNSRRKQNEKRSGGKYEFNGKNKRADSNRRKSNDQRKNNTRRVNAERRFNDIETSKSSLGSSKTRKSNSIPLKNILLKLNGVNKAMTFVQSGDNVTFLLCNLKKDGFEIERINNYVVPYEFKDNKISTLTELIINVSNQFISKQMRGKVYLAIHSDNYQLQMTYVNVKGKSKKLFKKELLQTLKQSYQLNEKHGIYDFVSQKRYEKDTIVCLSNKRDQVKKDYKELVDAGLQPRYNTSIPQIINNIHTYYNLGQGEEYSLLIYIDRKKAHIVFSRYGQLFESMEINKGLNYFTDALIELSVVSQDTNDAKENALHFLSHYGIGPQTSESTIQAGIPFKKAQKILDHLIVSFIHDVKNLVPSLHNTEVVFFPTYPGLVNIKLSSPFHLGAQNCHWEESGAFTGEISIRKQN